MAVIKIACTKCGQRVSGDESFYGTTVECPVCSSIIAFPEPILSDKPSTAAAATTPSQGNPAGTPPAEQKADANAAPVSSDASSSASAADSGMPQLGGAGKDKDPALMQTTSIPLLPENIVTQNFNRIGALNAAMLAGPEEESSSSLQSILSMVFGILGLVFFPFGAALLCSPAAIIVGHIALAKGRHSRIQPAPGRTMALVGVILGYAGLCVILTLLATYSIWSKLVPGLSGE